MQRSYDPPVIPEAPLEQTDHGLFAGGEGWFVLNMRDVRWWYRGHGLEAGLSGDGDFPQVGIGLTVLGPGEPMAMYHWETDEENFLMLAGEALLIVEGWGAAVAAVGLRALSPEDTTRDRGRR